MKVLITGVNGLLGSNIAETFLKNDWEVIGILRKGANISAIQDLPVRLAYGEILQWEFLKPLVEEADLIIHAAATTDMSGQQLSDYAFNYDSTEQIIKACLLFPEKKLIFISTANAFGYGDKKQPGNESLAPDPLFLNSFYAQSKLKAQHMVMDACQKQQLNAIVLNPSFIIGPRDAKPSSGQIIQKAKSVLAFAPKGGKNFVPARDVAQAALLAGLSKISGECYLVVGDNLSYKEFFQQCQSVFHYPKVIIPLPNRLLIWAGKTLEYLAQTFQFSSLLNTNNARILTIQNYYSSKKIVQQLIWNASSLPKAIKDCYEWMEKNPS
ncbi:NAD-dependent epimerase/dehydratase family protein [Persicobacter sp. CCB-QB2]|uniref:NAD-dependent epimerase/dehydratase family protein n=1 Tax=Persicobacter sp. CCB-QB2 TaxID=1561025 RepID=UPI0006A9C0E0|nr:NAD-dependent epimerase/dehydratase family protein [Persicobacter sp. CCB-QB2]